MKTPRLALVGNPNCGKSTLFNLLTGESQKTGNWSGVTVCKKQGYYKHCTQTIKVIDLPGIYHLENTSHNFINDESITCNFIFSEHIDVIVNVIDSSNLERGLYLTSQLQDLDTPVIIVLNMMDISNNLGISINANKLSELSGCQVITSELIKQKKLIDLKNAINKAVTQAKTIRKTKLIDLDAEIENAIKKIQSHSIFERVNSNKRWHAIQVLEGVENSSPVLEDESSHLRSNLVNAEDKEIDILIASKRYEKINKVISEVQVKKTTTKKSISSIIDSFVLHKIFGIPVFLGAMYLIFFSSTFGNKVFTDFFESLAEIIFIDGSKFILTQLSAPQIAINILATGVGEGIKAVSGFIPTIFLLFCFLSILEKSGYMARAVVVVDKIMSYLGLPGKAFVPMLIGFGCNVPAIMAARTMENQRDKLLTISMIPFMSCSARLPVFTLFASLFFPNDAAWVIFLLYVFGILAALFTAVIMKKSILGNFSHSINFIELSNYQLPSFKEVVFGAWVKTKNFILKAGKLIVIITLILNLLGSIKVDGSFNNEGIGNSLLSSIGKSITPFFNGMGIDDNNWPATVGIMTGFLAKETIVGTVTALYATPNNEHEVVANSSVNDDRIINKLSMSLSTIPNNFLTFFNLKQAEEELVSADANTVAMNNNIIKSFSSIHALIAYLLFILLYTPCIAVIAIMNKEVSAIWSAIISTWSLFLAYSVATLYYQVSIIYSQPGITFIWVISISMLILMFMLFIRKYSQKFIFSKSSISVA